MTTPILSPSPSAPAADEDLLDQPDAPLAVLGVTNAAARLQAWAPDPDAGQKYQLGLKDLSCSLLFVGRTGTGMTRALPPSHHAVRKQRKERAQALREERCRQRAPGTGSKP